MELVVGAEAQNAFPLARLLHLLQGVSVQGVCVGHLLSPAESSSSFPLGGGTPEPRTPNPAPCTLNPAPLGERLGLRGCLFEEFLCGVRIFC